MIVFRNYFKLVKSYLPFIILYTVIFVFFAVFTTVNDSSSADFTAAKPRISFINNDTNTLLLQSFKEYLSENSTLVEIENKEEKLKDALFSRNVYYIVIIPENFTEDYLAGKNPKINTMSTPDGNSSYIEMLMNRYFTLADMYRLSGMVEEDIVKNISIDIKQEANVIVESSVDSSKISKVKFFFNFANYTFLAICIMIVGMILGSFNQKIIKRRNIISSKKYSNINLQLFLGNCIIMIFIWLFYVILSFIIYGEIMATLNGLLFIINSFIFGILALSIGFLIGNTIVNKEVSSAITNVVALGSSFLCGAFVPQEMLGDGVLNVARVLPSYWYIKNNELISVITEFNLDNIKPIIGNMLIILGFAILFLSITLLVTKRKIQQD